MYKGMSIDEHFAPKENDTQLGCLKRSGVRLQCAIIALVSYVAQENFLYQKQGAFIVFWFDSLPKGGNE